MKTMRIDVCDFHTHLLPKADHGSSSIETSVFQLKSAELCGVSRIVATPHFYPHMENVESFLNRRNKAYKLLFPHIPESVSVRLGAEVLFCGNMENIPNVESLCINGTKTMLLELPFADFDLNELSSIGALADMGIDIIIAHAERYSDEVVNECIDYGVKLQVNSSFITKGLAVKKRVKGWLDGGLVSAIGSDIHKRDQSAYKCFRKSIKKIKSYIDLIKERSDAVWDKSCPLDIYDAAL